MINIAFYIGCAAAFSAIFQRLGDTFFMGFVAGSLYMAVSEVFDRLRA